MGIRHPDIFLAQNSQEDGIAVIQFFIKYQLIDRLFQVEGYEAALEHLLSKTNDGEFPRLIIFDLSDQYRTKGIKLIKQIKVDSDLQKIPIVVLTDTQNKNDIIEMYRLSISGSILKPVNLVKFQRIVSLAGIPYEYFKDFQESGMDGRL